MDSEVERGQQKFIRVDEPPAYLGLEKLLCSELMFDVTFKVGPENEEIRAHKLILVIASEVFHAMFCGLMPEGDSVSIPDCDPEAFRLMLKFIYTGNFPTVISVEMGLELFYLARKYALQTYERYTVAFLQVLMKKMPWNGNVLSILGASILYDSFWLERNCWKYIDDNIKDIVRCKQFRDLDKTILCKLLQRDGLKIPEIDLFNGLIGWGYAEMERTEEVLTEESFQNLMRPYLLHIRFPTMSITEFLGGPVERGVLNAEEIKQVLQWICESHGENVQLPDCPYSTVPRTYNKKVQKPANGGVRPSSFEDERITELFAAYLSDNEWGPDDDEDDVLPDNEWGPDDDEDDGLSDDDW